MAHDHRVSAQYYQVVRGAGDAKQAYDTMSKVVNKLPDNSRQQWDMDEIMTLFKNYIENNKTPSLS